MKKKLIGVALLLEAINKESAREKSIRHERPSTLHLRWARGALEAWCGGAVLNLPMNVMFKTGAIQSIQALYFQVVICTADSLESMPTDQNGSNVGSPA